MFRSSLFPPFWASIGFLVSAGCSPEARDYSDSAAGAGSSPIGAGGGGGSNSSMSSAKTTPSGGSSATGGASHVSAGGQVATSSKSSVPEVVVGSTVGKVGADCAPDGTYGCAGDAQRNRLACSAGHWISNGSCNVGEACDTSRANAGQCMSVVSVCKGKKAGDLVCNGQQIVECGPDLVSTTINKTCTEQACVNAACTGSCEPSTKRCGTGAASVETCTEEGTWSSEACLDAKPICANAVCVAPPSCEGLAANCGTSGNDSCCSSPLVPGGTFKRNYDGVNANDGSYTGKVSAFRLDKYEVTVGRFRNFLAAWNAGYRPAAGAGKHAHLNGGKGLVDQADPSKFEAGWEPSMWDAGAIANDFLCGEGQSYTSSAAGNDTLPMNCARWAESYAFCIWDGGFLPSDTEFNFAASGGSEQRVYPWSSPASSNDIDCRYANFKNGVDPCYTTLVVSVGSLLGSGRWGQVDLAGNLEEPMLDWVAAGPANCEDCAVLDALQTVGPFHMARSGAYNDEESLVRATSHESWLDFRQADRGFRCARSP